MATKTAPIEGTPRPLRDPYILQSSSPSGRHLLAYGKHEGVLRAKCVMGCQKLYDIPVTPEQFAEFNSGPASRHVQQIFPNLSADDRELLVSGMCGTCFDATFADEPDDDEKAAAAEVESIVAAPVVAVVSRSTPRNHLITGHEFVPMDGNPDHCAAFQCGFPRSDHARVPVDRPKIDDKVLAGEVISTWLSLLDAEQRKNVEGWRNAVVTRMSGCAEPNCLSCRANRETVAELMLAVRTASQTPGVVTYKLARDNDGEADAFVIAPHKALHRLPPRNDVHDHSPDGFEWGYDGSGPTQLALALCIHALGGDVVRAQRVYMRYRSRVLAQIMSADYTLTQPEVVAVIEAIEQEMRDATKDDAHGSVES